jgi:hypothetical protein
MPKSVTSRFPDNIRQMSYGLIQWFAIQLALGTSLQLGAKINGQLIKIENPLNIKRLPLILLALVH